MALKDDIDGAGSGADASFPDEPPRSSGKRLRLPLATLEDVSRELARLYREARVGRVPVQDASRMANILSIAARVLEGSEVERRVGELEERIRSGK